MRGYGFEGNSQYFPSTFGHGFWDFGEKNGQTVMISSVFVLRLCLIDVPGLNCLNCSSKGGRGDSSKCGFPQNALGNGILQHQYTFKILDLFTIADLKRFTITLYGLRPREVVG